MAQGDETLSDRFCAIDGAKLNEEIEKLNEDRGRLALLARELLAWFKPVAPGWWLVYAHEHEISIRWRQKITDEIVGPEPPAPGKQQSDGTQAAGVGG
jgi:hypothetical protein